MSKTKLMTAWFCPFVQRSWIAMLEKSIDFDVWEIDPYNKTPEFLALNPRGLVPTLVHEGQALYESTVINEYIEDVWPEPRLLPLDPYGRAQARIWVDFVAKQVTPPFYQILMYQDKDKQKEAKDRFTKRLAIITSAMDPKGPYFFGEDFGLVDLTLLPHCLRFPILERYRQFSLPSGAPFDRLRKWLEACQARPSVKATMPDMEKLIAKYQRYADDSAQTEVADAIRQGSTLP